MKANNKRITSLEGIRGIAFISIVLSHTMGIVPGRWGVSVFLILSGFVMMYTYWDRDVSAKAEDAASFAVKKILKLYPVHFIMVIVGLFYALLFFEPSIKDLIWSLPITTLLLQSLTPYSYQAFNSVSWYLSATMLLYFAFPFIYKLLKKPRTTFGYLLAVALIAFCAQIITGLYISKVPGLDFRWFFYCFPLFRLGDYVVGCCLGSCFRLTKNSIMSNTAIATIIEVMIIVAVLACIVVFKRFPKELTIDWYTYAIYFLPVNALLIFIFAFNGGLVSRIISCKPIMFIAKISPYAFLIHIHVMHFTKIALESMQTGLNENMFNIVVTIIVFVISAILSMAYMKVQESYYNRQKTKRINRSDS